MDSAIVIVLCVGAFVLGMYADMALAKLCRGEYALGKLVKTKPEKVETPREGERHYRTLVEYPSGRQVGIRLTPAEVERAHAAFENNPGDVPA